MHTLLFVLLGFGFTPLLQEALLCPRQPSESKVKKTVEYATPECHLTAVADCNPPTPRVLFDNEDAHRWSNHALRPNQTFAPTGALRYSCGYYIYALKHILI